MTPMGLGLGFVASIDPTIIRPSSASSALRAIVGIPQQRMGDGSETSTMLQGDTDRGASPLMGGGFPLAGSRFLPSSPLVKRGISGCKTPTKTPRSAGHFISEGVSFPVVLTGEDQRAGLLRNPKRKGGSS